MNDGPTEYSVLVNGITAMTESTGSKLTDWTEDGEKHELTSLLLVTIWMQDMIRHQEAEKLRRVKVSAGRGSAQTFRDGRMMADGISWAADHIDPFERNHAGQWLRKSDGAPVPWPVVRD